MNRVYGGPGCKKGFGSSDLLQKCARSPESRAWNGDAGVLERARGD